MDVVRDIIRGFKAEIGGRILYFATTGAVLIFLARFLSPRTYGVVFLGFSLLSVGQLFGDLAIPASAAKYIAEYDQLDRERVGYIVALSFTAVVGTSILVGAVLFAFHKQIATLFDEPALGAVLLTGSIMILCRTLYKYFRKILQGFKHLGSSASVYGIEGVARLAFVVAFVLLGFGAVGAIGGYILGYVSAAVVGAVAFYRHIYPDVTIRLGGDPEIRARVLKYAIPLLGTRGAKVADNRIDTALVGFFLTPTAVGFYTLSKQAVHLLQAPASALGFSVGPWFGDQKAAGNVDRIGEIYTSSLAYMLLLYIPITAGLALLARHALLIVFGEAYVPATTLLQIFSTLAILQAIEEVSENALDYLGRARERSIGKGATAFVNLGIIVLLVPIVGVIGAAVAKVATHAIYVLTLLYIMYGEVNFSVREVGRKVGLILVVTGVMSAAVRFASRFISGILTLAAVITLGGAVWVTLSVSLGLLDAETITSLR